MTSTDANPPGPTDTAEPSDAATTFPRVWRESVGGLWYELGTLQLDYLLRRGLRPNHHLLDLGCGCLRAGVHFIRYLDADRYCGMDKDSMLLSIGIHTELDAAELHRQRPRFRCGADFDATSFAETFDFVFAQSLFTHLTLNCIQRCLWQVRRVLAPDGQFLATFFEDPTGDHQACPIHHEPGGIVSYPDADPYHYSFPVLQALADTCGLQAEHLGCWNHPRAQRIVCFTHNEQQGGVTAP